MRRKVARKSQQALREKADASMLFGHNTNVTVGQLVYHVQTEDRGTTNALIDTTVYCHGRVVHRRTHNYFDLMPLEADREEQLRQRIDQQHRAVVEEIRSGVLQITAPPAPPKTVASAKRETATDSRQAPPSFATLSLELMNAKSWLAGRRANLQIAVRHQEKGDAVAGARVTARMDGAATPAETSAETGIDGQVQLEFDMPRFTAANPALVIEAVQGLAKGQLRFQLRAKQRVTAP